MKFIPGELNPSNVLMKASWMDPPSQSCTTTYRGKYACIAFLTEHDDLNTSISRSGKDVTWIDTCVNPNPGIGLPCRDFQRDSAF